MFDPTTTVTLSASVEYSLEDSVTPIQDLIDLLESAKSEGATHVVGTTGNYRGAQWERIHDMYGWADDDE